MQQGGLEKEKKEAAAANVSLRTLSLIKKRGEGGGDQGTYLSNLGQKEPLSQTAATPRQSLRVHSFPFHLPALRQSTQQFSRQTSGKRSFSDYVNCGA